MYFLLGRLFSHALNCLLDGRFVLVGRTMRRATSRKRLFEHAGARLDWGVVRSRHLLHLQHLPERLRSVPTWLSYQH